MAGGDISSGGMIVRRNIGLEYAAFALTMYRIDARHHYVTRSQPANER